MNYVQYENLTVFKMYSMLYLADPGKARGCSTNNFVIDSLSHKLILYFHILSKTLYPNVLSYRSDFFTVKRTTYISEDFEFE